MTTPITPGQRVAWSAWRPQRHFSGIVRAVGPRTAHVETRRADGRRKMRYVKIGRLVTR